MNGDPVSSHAQSLEPPCSCQYGNDPPNFTPRWYVTVKTCPRHWQLYDPLLAPDWARTMCGPGGAEVANDKARMMLAAPPASPAVTHTGPR